MKNTLLLAVALLGLWLALPAAALSAQGPQSREEEREKVRNPEGDVIEGGPGNDEIRGGLGDDVLRGGPGDDVVRGGPAKDTIEGGPGNDQLEGEGQKERAPD